MSGDTHTTWPSGGDSASLGATSLILSTFVVAGWHGSLRSIGGRLFRSSFALVEEEGSFDPVEEIVEPIPAARAQPRSTINNLRALTEDKNRAKKNICLQFWSMIPVAMRQE